MVLAILLVGRLVAPSEPVIAFVGSTPCDAPARQFIGVPAAAECERIQWTLALPSSGSGTFTLDGVWGMQAINNPGFAGGGNPVRLQGAVTTVTGARRSYRLAAGARRLEFTHLDHDLIHMLGANGAVMVGNPGWSYTLSARDPGKRGAPESERRTSDAGRIAGVFEGRTPCEALERDLDRPRNPECTKVKWRLTFRDHGYVLEGFGYARNGTPPRTGRWGASGDTIQLDPDAPQRFLTFRVVEGRLLLFLDKQGRPLVGDEYYSYTLNKIR